MCMAQFADLGHPIESMDHHIQNIVACYKHTERINLDRLARKYSLEYFPELFPAVRYRDNYRKVTVNIFTLVVVSFLVRRLYLLSTKLLQLSKT